MLDLFRRVLLVLLTISISIFLWHANLFQVDVIQCQYIFYRQIQTTPLNGLCFQSCQSQILRMVDGHIFSTQPCIVALSIHHQKNLICCLLCAIHLQHLLVIFCCSMLLPSKTAHSKKQVDDLTFQSKTIYLYIEVYQTFHLLH